MKKRLVFVLTVLTYFILLQSCYNMKEGIDRLKNGKTHKLIVENNSDWRVIVSIKGVKLLYDREESADFVICKKDDVYGIENVSEFDVYDDSTVDLISVNGARVKLNTSDRFVLENYDRPINVKVINKTNNDIILKNEPYVKGGGVGWYYSGDFQVGGIIYPQRFYIPLFKKTLIYSTSNETNPVNLDFFAWQLSEILEDTKKTDFELSNEINEFAKTNIKNTNNGKALKTSWQKKGNDLFLFLTN